MKCLRGFPPPGLPFATTLFCCPPPAPIPFPSLPRLRAVLGRCQFEDRYQSITAWDDANHLKRLVLSSHLPLVGELHADSHEHYSNAGKPGAHTPPTTATVPF